MIPYLNEGLLKISIKFVMCIPKQLFFVPKKLKCDLTFVALMDFPPNDLVDNVR